MHTNAEKSKKSLDLNIDDHVVIPIFDNYNGFFLGLSNVSSKVINEIGASSLSFSKLFTVSNPSSLDRVERYPKTKYSHYDRCVFTENDLINDRELAKITEPCITGEKILRYVIHGENLFTNTIWYKDGNQKTINSKTYALMKSQKLIGQRITGQAKWRIVFTFDDSGLISMPSVNIITINDGSKNHKRLLNLLAVLNSKIFNYLYKDIFRENNTNITSDVFDIIPIPLKSIDSVELHQLVSKILKNGYNKSIDSEVDNIIYKLYGLTNTDISIVESCIV